MGPFAGYRGRKTTLTMVAAATVLLLSAAPARPATFDVTTAAELQAALTAAQANGQHDLVRVAESATAYVGNFTYAPAAGENFNLTIQGGWKDGFTYRDPNPDDSKLDGNATGRALALTCPYDTTGSVRVEGLWLTNGKTTGDALWGGGLYVKTAAPGAISVIGNYISNNAVETRGGGLYVDSGGGSITVEGNQIQQNTSSGPGDGNLNLPFAGGAYVHCFGECNIVNNLIIGNTTSDNDMGGGKGGGLMVLATAGPINVVNNTIVGNNAYTYGGGVYLGPSGPTTALHFNLYNNIIRGNSTTVGWRGDHDIQNGVCEADPPLGHTVTIDHNDYKYLGDWTCSIAPTVTNNFDADPLFAAGGGYQLQSSSPCVDAGNNAAPALPVYDCYGDPRVFAYKDRLAPVVDVGWDEYADYTLSLDTPAPGAAWLNDGVAKSITWTCSNIAGDVNIVLWRGPRYSAVKVLDIATVPCSDQSYSFTIPADLPQASDYAVVINSASYTTIESGVYPITIQRILTLTAPNGGQSVVQGSTRPITWRSTNLAGALVKIQLYKGAALAATVAAGAPNTGSFSWKVPYALAPGANYRIRISTTSPLSAVDWSDGTFSIVPALALTAPNGGQIIKRGTAYRITWTYKYTPGSFVRLDLYKGGVLNRVIVASTPVGTGGKGAYTWTIPAAQLPAKTYTIRVRSTKYPNCFDFGNKAFTITR